jgi:hypothetical protein
VVAVSFVDEQLNGRFTSIKTDGMDKEYRFDKLIFLSIVLFLLGFSIVALSINNFDKSDKIYVNCNSDTKCENPYYQSREVCGTYLPVTHELCTQEYLVPHYTYGRPAPWYVNNFGNIAGILLLLGFGLNHVKYNMKRGKNDN